MRVLPLITFAPFALLGVPSTSHAQVSWEDAAVGCVKTYPSVEQQDDCFRTWSALKDGRTPEQVRAYVAERIEWQRLEEEHRAADRKREQEAEVRERNECVARSSLPASEVAVVRVEKVQLGMSEAALLCSWGRPERVNRSVGSWGEHKQYIYGGRYVYVENGKVTSWQD